MKLSLALGLLLNSLGLPSSSGVLYGDEQYGNMDGGLFWVFTSSGVSIVNPDTCTVENNTITKDTQGNLLPGSWYDGVYMEHCPSPPPGSDMTDCSKYVAINSAVAVSDTHGQEAGSGEVLFFDAKKQEVASRVLVGPRPVHSYGVYTHNQYWTHSDGDGHFYVIDLEDIEKHTGKPIKVMIEDASHGKLLWDESSVLQNTGYVTSTGEPHLFIVDLETHDQLGTFDFSDQQGCFGSHAIGFSRANHHLFVECTGPGGTLEIDVSTPRSPVLVKQYTDITGSIYESPDESYISITDKGGNKLHLLEPGATGSPSTVDHSITIDGHPQGPVWYPNSADSDTLGKLDYKVCLALTLNTNLNHYDSNGDLACDYYGCSPAETADDVAAGLCLYDSSGRSLLQANLSQITDVTNGVPPFGQGCARCSDTNNYDENDNICVCTPECGSCAPSGTEHHNGDLSGAYCLDLSEVVNHRHTRKLDNHDPKFVSAGSVQQGSPYSYSPECGFGRTYRPHKRGSFYDAMPTDYPEPSLSLVDMRDFSFKCRVPLPGKPGRVIYTPNMNEGSSSSSSSLSGGAIAGIVVGSFFGCILVVAVVMMVMGSKSGGGTEPIDKNTPDNSEQDSTNISKVEDSTGPFQAA